MSVLSTLLRVFSHLTESETLRSAEMMCSSSVSIMSCKPSMSWFLFMLLNALLMPSMIRRADSFLAVIVLSMIGLEVKICSVVDLFGL